MSEHNEHLDRATRDRLSKLRSMSVDLSRLEQRLASQLPPKQRGPMTQVSPMRSWLRLAAMFVLFAGAATASYIAFLGVGHQAAVAQTMTITELHEHLLRDRSQTYLAESIEDAQVLLNAQLAGQQPLPTVDGMRVESCCLVEGDFPLRTALVVKLPEGNATIIIAQGDDFAHPMKPINHPSGVQLQGHEHAGLPMVMRNEGDLWMCVMGEIDPSDLADIAAAIHLP